MFKKKLGDKGEDIAANYLKNNGYKILDRNFYTREGELDIICTKDNIIVFVEVKTRTSTTYGLPEEAVIYKKIERIKKVALKYLNNCDAYYKEIRFDVIAITIKGNTKTINHIENAF